MQYEPKVPLIGGSSHGQSIRVNNNTDEVEIDVHTTDSPMDNSTFTQAYERRHFNGDEFGEGFDCFALKSDDETEQKELARWSLNQPGISDQV